VGLDLVLPLASTLPLERHVRWAHAKQLPGKVAEQLLGASALGAGALAAALLGKAKLPGPLRLVQGIAGALLSKEVLDDAVKLAGDKLREANAEAVAKHNYLTAMLPVLVTWERRGSGPSQEPQMSLIWATRGRTWGFRFLRDGGFPDPLPVYDLAFSSVADEPEACGRVDEKVALRFPDPLGRKDAAGRVIPHEFVVFRPLADEIDSVEDGLRLVWPKVADEYARVWDQPNARSAIV
jgi:hypothetical protein